MNFKNPVAKLLILVVAIAAAVGLALILAPRPMPAPITPVVSATVFPIYDIARNIAGDAVSVRLILPPGGNPHTFEPAPAQVRAAAESKVIFAVGHGLDGWIEQLSRVAGVSAVVVDKGIALVPSTEPLGHEAGEEDEEEHGPIDPHYWLTVPNAKTIAATIADDLAMRFPSLAQEFRTNLAAYQVRLDAADQRIRKLLAAAPAKKIVTFHDAWYYFSKEYGLTIVGSFEPSAGREPTPRYLAELSQAVAETGTKVIYAEPGSSVDAIAAFAADNGLELRRLDPVEGVKSDDDYIDIMISNAEIISQ